MSRRVVGVVGFILIVGASSSLTSCSSFGECGPPNSIYCGDGAFGVSAPCEIVGYWTTCLNPVTCLHGECSFPTTHDETCSITVKFDDNTTATTHVSVNSPKCGCKTISGDDFVRPSGSKCSPPVDREDASVIINMPDASIVDAPTDVAAQ